MLGTLGPRGGAARPAQLLHLPFLHLLRQLRHPFRGRAGQRDPYAHAAAIARGDPGRHGFTGPVVMCLFPDIRHDRAGGPQIPQHGRKGLPDHPALAVRERPGMPHQVPVALQAVHHLVTETFPQCREMCCLFRAPGQEKGADEGVVRAVVVPALIRRCHVIHSGMI